MWVADVAVDAGLRLLWEVRGLSSTGCSLRRKIGKFTELSKETVILRTNHDARKIHKSQCRNQFRHYFNDQFILDNASQCLVPLHHHTVHHSFDLFSEWHNFLAS